MYTDTEGIVLRQIKTANGRRMISILSQKYGKISAGTSLNEKSGKNKTALSLRPFTYGRYELFKTRDTYNINSGEVIKSRYRIGEDVEKYMAASYALEFTAKALEEDMPAPEFFRLLNAFLDALETRPAKHETLLLAFLVKALALLGHMPVLETCASCGSAEPVKVFSVPDGGLLCADCAEKAKDNKTLIFNVDFDIVNVLQYFAKTPFESMERIALEGGIATSLRKILKEYAGYHLDIGDLKSDILIK